MDRGRLTRSETDKMVAGVCGGLGEFFTVDPTIVRIVFVIASFFGGGGVLLYIAMWIIVPRASQVDVPSRDVVRENVNEGRRFAEDAARSAKEGFDRLRGAAPGEPGSSGEPGQPTGTVQPDEPVWARGAAYPDEPAWAGEAVEPDESAAAPPTGDPEPSDQVPPPPNP